MVIVEGAETTETYLFHVFDTQETCAYFRVIWLAFYAMDLQSMVDFHQQV